MPENDKLQSIIKIPRGDRKGARLELERPVGTLNTVAMRLMVTGRAGTQPRRQFYNDLFSGKVVIPLPDDFLSGDVQAWVRATLSVGDPAGAGANFEQRGMLAFQNGASEPLWDEFSMPAGASFDYINLTWLVVE